MNRPTKRKMNINKKSKDEYELTYTLNLSREETIKRRNQLELDLRNYDTQYEHIIEERARVLTEIEAMNLHLNDED